MSANQSLFSLQGYLRIATLLDNGSIGPLRWMGNVPEATLALTTEAAEKNESFGGQRLQIGRMPTATAATFNYTLDYWSTPNLALAFNAEEATIAPGSVTGETFPAGLVALDQVRLDHPFVTSLALTDSAGTPAPVATNKYRLTGHSDSVVELLDVGGYTQPFKAAYSHPEISNLVLFSKLGKAVYLQFDGINTENGKPVLLDLWKVRHNPVSQLSLINNEYGNLPMTTSVLYDTARGIDPALGGFGRMLQRTA